MSDKEFSIGDIKNQFPIESYGINETKTTCIHDILHATSVKEVVKGLINGCAASYGIPDALCSEEELKALLQKSISNECDEKKRQVGQLILAMMEIDNEEDLKAMMVLTAKRLTS